MAQELYLLGSYGLRNKRELWRAQTRLSTVRKQARRLLAATQEVRLREEKEVLSSLRRSGLVSEGATLDDILSLTVEDVLARRLQTMVFKKGMAVSPLHARQLIVHRHIVVNGRRIGVPGYNVNRGEEDSIGTVGVGPKEPPSTSPQPTEARTEETVAPR